MVETHNLDRMLGASAPDAGRAKVDVVAENLRRSATHGGFACRALRGSVVEEAGFAEALDCDVLFSCVDRPWARQVLNHAAYSCLIPVVNGGVRIDSPRGRLADAVYRAETVGPRRACMDCLGSLDAAAIQPDRDGLFDGPAYLGDRGRVDGTDERQNVMPFVLGLAGTELMQFVELVTRIGGRGDLGQQQYDYRTGEMTAGRRACRRGCGYAASTALGDACRPYLGVDKSPPRGAAARGGHRPAAAGGRTA